MLADMNLLLALALSAGVVRAEPATLQDYQVTAKQVTLKLSRPVGFRASTTATPPAIVITLEDTRIAQAVQEKSVASALVAGVAALPLTSPEGESARIIIKLAKPREFTATPNGNDLIVDLLEAAPASPAAAPPENVPATVEKAEPKKPAPKKAVKYLIQVGVFSAEAAATELKKDLDSAETEVEVQKAQIGGKAMFRVLVGPARSRADAQALAGRLKDLGHPGLLYKAP